MKTASSIEKVIQKSQSRPQKLIERPMISMPTATIAICRLGLILQYSSYSLKYLFVINGSLRFMG